MNIPFIFGILCATFAYVLIRAISYHFSTRLYPALAKSNKTKAELVIFHTYLNSTIHATVQTFGNFYPALMSLLHWNNRVTHFNTDLVDATNELYMNFGPTFWHGIFVGYLLTDLIAIAGHEKPLMIMHHITAIFTWTYAVHCNVLQWYMCFLQFNELSTIFLSSRHLLVTGWDMKNSSLVKCIEAMTFVAFAIVRVLPLPFLLYNFWTTDMNVLKEQAGAGIFYNIWVVLIFHSVMQSFWFYLLCKIAFCKKKKKQLKEL